MSVSDLGGLNIACFDAGSPADVLSQLFMLKEILRSLDTTDNEVEDLKPSRYIDLFGGSGLGAIVAFLLGSLGMTISEALEALQMLLMVVFCETDPKRTPIFDSSPLSDALESIIQSTGKMATATMRELEENLPSQTVLFACPREDITHCLPLSASGHQSKFTAVEVVIASVSSPHLFSHAEVGSGRRKRSYVGPGIAFFNPIREILREAERIYGAERGIATVLSFGSGISEMFVERPRGGISEAESYLNEATIAGGVTTAEVGYQFFAVGAYIRLAVPGGFQNTTLNSWAEWDTENVERRTENYMRSEEVTKSVRYATEEIIARSKNVTLGRLNYTAIRVVTPKAIPPVSPYFVLRPKAWDFMKTNLLTAAMNEQLLFIMSGMGGVGKTQMTSFWVQEYGTRYDRIFFVDARSPKSLRNDLQRAIRSLGGEYGRATFSEALDYLGSHKGWLLIYDNADDPNLGLEEYIPKATHGTIIVTTRNRDLGLLTAVRHWELGPMSTEEGVEALCRAAHVSVPGDLRDDDTAVKLVQRLGGLALALVQAGSYCYRISSTTILYFSFLDYLALLEVEEALLDDPTMSTLDDYGKSVYATLNISYEQLPEVTRQFLHMAAYFHHSDIALLMLTTAVDNDFHWDKMERHKRPPSYQEARHGLSDLLKPPTRATILRLHDIVFSLQSFSLVTPTMSPTSVLLRFHPIVHSWARTQLPVEPNSHFRQMATQVVAGCCNETLYRLHPILVPHIYVMIDRHDVLHPNDRVAFQWLLRDQGDYKLAETLADEQVAHMIGEFGERHNFTAAAIGNLAVVHARQGRWEEAIDGLKHATILSDQLVGADHPTTLSLAENLAQTYEKQGALDEAERWYKELMKRWRDAAGEEDLRTLLLMGSLSRVYGKNGKFQEAESLSLYVIATMSDLLEENDPILLRERSNLGNLYLQNNHHEEAELIHRESIPLFKTTLGETNPVTSAAGGMLAVTLLQQERWEEAEPLLVDTLKNSRRMFGDEHPETMRLMDELATVYLETGRHGEAEELMEDLLKLRTSTAGPHHEDTIIAMHDLASMYRRHEKFDKCVELASKCLIVTERVKGEQADLTLKTLELLGQAYTIMKDWKNANSIYTILLVRQRRKYGPSVTVGDTILYLSKVCFEDNQLADGLNLLTEAMDLAEQLEGCEDPGLPDFYQQLVYMLHQIPGALSKIS